MAFGDSDLPAFFADMGEPAVINGQSVTVFVDTPAMPWEARALGSIEQGFVTLTAPVTAFAALPVAGQAVTFHSSSFTVKSRKMPEMGG